MNRALSLLLQLALVLVLVLAVQLHADSARSPGGRLPPYMMQLYRTVSTEDPGRSPAAHTGTEDGPGLRGSDSVTSLIAKSVQQFGSRWSVTFDMFSVSSNNSVQLAELRIRLPAFAKSSRVSVDVYLSHKGRCQGKHCPKSRRFLGHLRAHPSPVASSSSSSSWKVFNMTKMLIHWLQQQPPASKPKEEPEVMEEPEERANQPTVDHVMMVIFFKHNRNPTGQQMATLIRTAEHSKYVSLERKQAASCRGSKTSTWRTKRHHEKQRVVEDKRTEEVKVPLCTRVDMWVDFMQLGWSEWIVYPKWYNSYRCEGGCPIPLDETFTTTNHAFMQSLLKQYHPDKVPPPSCVPTRLAPLSMLYFENGKMITRHHENMVVEECGCF